MPTNSTNDTDETGQTGFDSETPAADIADAIRAMAANGYGREKASRVLRQAADAIDRGEHDHLWEQTVVTETEHAVLELLDDNPLRIEDIADELDIDYTTAKQAVLSLHERSLVVSGPEFTFESDTGGSIFDGETISKGPPQFGSDDTQ